MYSKAYKMQVIRHALELFVQSIEDESVMMEVADLYPEWKPNVRAENGKICRHGVNDEGEPQLYQYIGTFVTQAQYPPDSDITHYKKVGIGEDGIKDWTLPTCAEDAYDKGDIRRYLVDGKLYISVYDGKNSWAPDVYGWELYEG